MEVGANLICMVKTNIKVFCKETISKLTRDWTGGYHLVLSINHMVPRGRLIIAIGYKYNVHKLLSLIITDNTGITQLGLPYLSKYPEQFINFSIRPVARPLLMFKFFYC